ncbi:MAG: glycosyltransferase family 39 protein, partial [Deltaproteobacteria bacterium]|nr:glycosyltransferase family 39 protein [Deltaproteobacteria bacterium]
MKETTTRDKSLLLFLGFVLLTGCVLRCWNINQSFWWDEIWSTMPYVKTGSLWHVVSSLGYYFNNHILYSLLARVSINIFGESEFAARLPALIMGLLAVTMVFKFGKTFLGTPCGFIAAVLLAVSAFHIDHSSEARGYSGLALFALLSSFYFLKGLKRDGFNSWILYIVFTVLGFYAHVFMIAVSISQFFSSFLFVVVEKWGSLKDGITKKAFKHFLVSLSCAGIAVILIYSPILATFFYNMSKVQFVNVNRIPFVMSLLNSFFPGVLCITGNIIYGILFFFGMYCTLRKDPHLFIYLFVMLVLPLSLYLFINPMFVFERYFVFALPFALLIVSQGVVGVSNILKGFTNVVLFFSPFFFLFIFSCRP